MTEAESKDVQDRGKLPPKFAALAQNNPALFRLLFETSIDPIEIFDERMNFLYVSPGFELLIGRPIGELIGTYALALIHPDDREQHEVEIEKLRKTGILRVEGLRVLHGDGSTVVVDVALQTCDPGDGSTLIIAFKHDITERVRAEERYRELVGGIEAVVWEADARSFTFTFVSPRAVEVFGYPVEDWYEPGFFVARLHPEDRDRTYAACVEAVEEVEDQVLLYRMKSASGADLWVRDMIRVVPAADGGAVLLRGVLADVTTEIVAAAERQRLESELRQAQKLDAIGRLAGGIAHDFNNLLTAISGYAELALAEPGADPVRSELDEIHAAATRAAGLTRQLLAFSRQQELRLEPVDINEIVGEMGGMLQRLIGTQVELVIDLAPGLRPIEADTSQMQQVVLNLAVNARDAMPGGGRLDVRTANVERDGRPVVVLSVADTGTGMDAATRERLFEPFFTTKVVGEGTGLGLATVHGIVEQSGGEIEVESEPGRGTTFRVVFPAAAGDHSRS